MRKIQVIFPVECTWRLNMLRSIRARETGLKGHLDRRFRAPFTRTRSCQCDEWRCKWLAKGKQSEQLPWAQSAMLLLCTIVWCNIQTILFHCFPPLAYDAILAWTWIVYLQAAWGKTFFIFLSSWTGGKFSLKLFLLLLFWFLLSEGSLPTAEEHFLAARVCNVLTQQKSLLTDSFE